jgi:hypothetical protein
MKPGPGARHIASGVDLASIHSEAENILVRALHIENNPGWGSTAAAAYLGAEESEGSWSWSDGSAWDYSPHSTGGNYCQNGDAPDNENCKRFDNYGGDETRIAMSFNYGDQKWGACGAPDSTTNTPSAVLPTRHPIARPWAAPSPEIKKARTPAPCNWRYLII